MCVCVCVSEPPVTILKKLEDVRFPEASAVTIECELSRHNIEVKWMKVKQINHLYFSSCVLTASHILDIVILIFHNNNSEFYTA